MAQLGSGVYIGPISSGQGWSPPANRIFACCGLETGWTMPVLSLTFWETIKRTQVHLDQRDDLRNKQCALSYSPALAHPSRE